MMPRLVTANTSFFNPSNLVGYKNKYFLAVKYSSSTATNQENGSSTQY